jgi:hypothetical protein
MRLCCGSVGRSRSRLVPIESCNVGAGRTSHSAFTTASKSAQPRFPRSGRTRGFALKISDPRGTAALSMGLIFGSTSLVLTDGEVACGRQPDGTADVWRGGGLLALVALAACYVPARRAMSGLSPPCLPA